MTSETPTSERDEAVKRPAFTPLHLETRPAVETAAAAYYLNRSPQTLREWASKGTGLLTPLRVGARLAWPVSEIKKLMGVAQ